MGKFEKFLDWLNQPCFEYEDHRDELKLMSEMQQDKKEERKKQNQIRFLSHFLSFFIFLPFRKLNSYCRESIFSN